jgi:sugar phosphate isomerase/epimerase
MISRRGFLKIGATALCASGAAPLVAAPEKKRIPIGLQLYSVRGECKKDFPGTVEAVAKMGYEGVEFAGYYGRDAKALRKLLDDNGLKCCGSHIGVGSFVGDNLAGTIDFHKALGNRFLICPGMPGKYRKSKQGWLEAAKLFSDTAAKLKPHGLRCGYHNHTGEFKPLDGEKPWDIFFGHTPPEVVMQLDIGHCLNGGSDPAAVLKQYPGRAATVHVREVGGDSVVGQGKVAWADVLAACQTVAGTEWYIVELGGSRLGAMECARRSLEGLRKLTA